VLKLGFEVAQLSVAKYMVKRRGPPSLGWRTFLRNHAQDIAAMDLFVVPTIGFDLHYYNGVRTHRCLNKDAPVSRSVQRTGVRRPNFGGLDRGMCYADSA
jgi:hypothetical protein